MENSRLVTKNTEKIKKKMRTHTLRTVIGYTNLHVVISQKSI